MPNVIPQLSVTAIQEFIACPRKFRLRRVDRVRPSHRAVALAMGSAFHDAFSLALFRHGQGEPAIPEAVHQKFRDSLRQQIADGRVQILFDDGENEGVLADAGVRMLTALLGVFPMPERVHAIEKRFEIQLMDDETGEMLPVPFVGSIDAVTETDGRLQLLELKTAARRWDADKVMHDQQVTAYRMAMGNETTTPPDLRLAVVTKSKRPDVQLENLVRGRHDEAELVQTAFSVHRAIEAGVDHRQRSWACKACPVAGACAP